MYKKVITYGTFDLFHYGHYNLLKRARALGDSLTVGLSTDEFTIEKGKRYLLSFEERRRILNDLKFISLVIPEDSWEQKVNDIKRHEIDIFVMGSDWEGKFDSLKNYCEVVYLPRTEIISTTLLKDIIYGKS